MQVSGILSAWLMYHFDWSSMNYIVAGMMVIDLLFLVCIPAPGRIFLLLRAVP